VYNKALYNTINEWIVNTKDSIENIDINFQLICYPDINGGRLSLEIVCQRDGNDTMVSFLQEHSLENYQELLCVKNHLNEMIDALMEHSANCDIVHADPDVFESVKMSL
jgi:hypothetical protein